MELQPSNFEALHDLGVQLEKDGRRDAARRYLTQFVRTAPPALYAKELAQVNAILSRMP